MDILIGPNGQLLNWFLITLILIGLIPTGIMGVISYRVARRQEFGRVGIAVFTIAGMILGLLLTLAVVELLLSMGPGNYILS